jgi:hypothetical protein
VFIFLAASAGCKEGIGDAIWSGGWRSMISLFFIGILDGNEFRV